VRLPPFVDDRFEIDVGPAVRNQASIESRSRLPTRLTNLIGFESAFDDVGDRTIFAAGKPVCKLSGLGAAY
jgi:hypothetical protein